MKDDVTAQLVGMFHNGYKDLEPDARAALVDKITARVTQLSAERDGWREIATELLKIAFGDDNVLGDGEHPPLELIELREVGKLPATFVPALAQFWADLTRKHAQQRQARGVSASGRMVLAAENLEIGDVVVIDEIGNARRATPFDDVGEGEE